MVSIRFHKDNLHVTILCTKNKKSVALNSIMIEIILLSALTTLLILPIFASAATTAELENAPLEKTILGWSFFVL